MRFLKFLGLAASAALFTLNLAGSAAAETADAESNGPSSQDVLAAHPFANLPLSALATQPIGVYDVRTTYGSAHIFPTVAMAQAQMALAKTAGYATPANNLSYTAGNPVMANGVKIYAIFWAPPTLQSGVTAVMDSTYQAKMTTLISDIGGHGLYNVLTQYYQTAAAGGNKSYIMNNAVKGGVYVDTAPYPKGSCTYTLSSPRVRAADCISDADIQAEIAKVMAIKGWTGGINHLFMVFTAKGEGSCAISGTCTSSNQAYGGYCAYHSAFGLAGNPIIYTNEPYGDDSACWDPSTPEPNGAGTGIDSALTSASHEIMEAVTDPMPSSSLKAWQVAGGANAGAEIGDLCAWAYTSADTSGLGIPGTGTNSWDGGMANQMMNGHFYELQTEYSNHKAACVQIGP